MLPFVEIVGVTSTKMFFNWFAFLESEKEVNVTWALAVCQTMLKDQENIPHVIDQIVDVKSDNKCG